MRLDKFLQASRLIKRRTLANQLCQHGKVTINGKTAKAAKLIAPGDLLSITPHNNHTTTYEVIKTPSTPVPKTKAHTLYRQIYTP
jgi:ribosomal 50S subunit-recycling heat shock protein